MHADCYAQDVSLAEFDVWRQSTAVTHGFNSHDGFHMYYTSGTTGQPKGVLLSHRVVMMHAIGTVHGEGREAGKALDTTDHYNARSVVIPIPDPEHSRSECPAFGFIQTLNPEHSIRMPCPWWFYLDPSP